MTELKDLLQHMAGNARTYDVTEAAIRTSRRRRRLATASAPVALVVAVAAVALTVRAPQPPPTQPSVSAPPTAASASPVHTGPVACEMQRLPLPPGDWHQSVSTAISPNGRFIAGTVNTFSGPDKVVIWDNLQPTILPVTGSDPEIYSITDRGEAAGSFWPAPHSEEPQAFHWHSGELTILKGRNAEARSINNKGVMAGTVQGRPAIWRSPTANPEILPVPQDMWTGDVAAIDDDGNVAGSLGKRDAPFYDRKPALWWASATFQWLPRPEQLGEGWNLFATGFRGGKPTLFAAKPPREKNVYGETMWGSWDPRGGGFTLRPGMRGYTGWMVSEDGWQVIARGRSLFVASPTAEVELPRPEEAQGMAAYSFFSTPDWRMITSSLHGPERTGGIVAVIWRCS